MKKFILNLMLLSLCLTSQAVNFNFSAGTVTDEALKNKMEKNISEILTEINRAANNGSGLSLDAINMEQGAREHLSSLWQNLPFKCEENPVSKCLNDHQGYQVRGIKITLLPTDNNSAKVNRELTISLNRNGEITGVGPSLEKEENVAAIMGAGSDVDDLKIRHEILKWVETFQNYYNERDIKSLSDVFSDDVLIISGSKMMSERPADSAKPGETNVKRGNISKNKYLRNLQKIFNMNENLNVNFDNISVTRHAAKPNVYGVTLHQSWNTSSYKDEGWFFLLWDFENPDYPQIVVRTWQPDDDVKEKGVFTISDFCI